MRKRTCHTKTVLKKYAAGSVSSEDAYESLNLNNKEDLFYLVCAAGLTIYHIDRDKAESMADTAILLGATPYAST